MRCEECGTQLWRAGEIAPAGRYVRIDDLFLHVITLDQPGPLPGAFDGHRTLYHDAGFLCPCTQQAQQGAGGTSRTENK